MDGQDSASMQQIGRISQEGSLASLGTNKEDATCKRMTSCVWKSGS